MLLKPLLKAAFNPVYGSVAYLRLCDNEGCIHCSFLMGKASLAPNKAVTIPRLELTAATVSVRLGEIVKKELDESLDIVHYHTDSVTVLRYISNDQKRFQVFVANRVQTIRNLSDPSQWKYVDTKENPADDASRGLDAKALKQQQRWLRGPGFLWQPEKDWPAQPSSLGKVSNEDLEIKRQVNACVTTITDPPPASTVTKLFQSQSFDNELKSLDQASLDEPGYEKTPSQKGKNKVTKASSLYRLDPFVDGGLLRVGGRLNHADIPEESKHPVILPRKSHVTTLIIRHTHEQLGHAGRGHVLAKLRERYWIVKANSAVRQLISSCVMCRRIKSTPQDQKMADLPEDRLTPAPPFTVPNEKKVARNVKDTGHCLLVL
ncbi:uncharacterized protein [Acropora muricata]|uniref:uncharacterized protein n=1 Tax=Acropora muricata TaxID=159855 RepID=UPI0034E50D49